MSDSFDGIFDRMGKIIHGIYAPGISRVMMAHMGHTVNDRITHIHIRRGHVNSGAQNLFPVGIYAILHFFK